MKTIISKSFNIFLIISIIFVSFFNLPKVYAKTVGDLKKELNELQREADENKNKLKYTEAQIAKAKKDIIQMNIDMDRISEEIIKKNKEIENLNDEIKSKEEETKKLMEAMQLSNGELFYFEYVMGAETLTDFIFRLSVTEQLSEHNSDLVVQMNDAIEANEKRKVELANKTKELENKQDELAVNLKILANQKVKLDEFDRSIEDEIAVAREVLQMYKDAGCKDNEDINACASKLIPEDSGFVRPMYSGYVTSEFSKSRIHPVTKIAEGHAAIDVSNSNKSNTLIYAVANGKVANVFSDKYGGNQVVVHHKIKRNGVIKYYSSTYVHLASVYVRTGDVVFRNTAIGKMGNTGMYTTGSHLHLAISTGLRYKDYVSYSDYVAHSFNPRIVINFPSYYVTWSGR